TTYVVLAHPRPGRWRIAGDGIAEVRTAALRPAPRVRATLRHGRLSYRIAPRRGQTVTFAEHGRGVARTVTVARRSGSLRFRPADGAGGRRAITALVQQDDLPRTRITVARFVAPPRARPAKPRAVKLALGGSGDTRATDARAASADDARAAAVGGDA